jgi:hypothetical protein
VCTYCTAESVAQEILSNADRILVCCHAPALVDRTERAELGEDPGLRGSSNKWTSASVVLPISAERISVWWGPQPEENLKFELRWMAPFRRMTLGVRHQGPH